jgi:type I site-specific restriction endonuclease
VWGAEIASLSPEAKARVETDRMLAAAGWVLQAAGVNLAALRGVAVREFVLKRPHGRVDYLLFVDGEAVGVLENQVRKILGVRDVENLLHLGVEPQMHQ